jgi:septal ring factor EnvC (AmiA/AmiB activator)
MNQVQKARAAFSSGMASLKKERAAVRAEYKRVKGMNDHLNATIVEQNERLETLARNCAHYRERISELNNKLAIRDDNDSRQFNELGELRRALRNERIAYSKLERELSRESANKRTAVTIGYMLCALVLGYAGPQAWGKLQPVIASFM